ncbi:hypothetical protein L6164_013145 [Bauhinia variegata]|uniref:Uncharacterized protein n=1 Tax=Bauhinia variegata TaxID=167791 RepID=A0ACB9PC70_BAUVA|nr:hypothetical protein L6164_013145 [Bauhinia variegata]
MFTLCRISLFVTLALCLSNPSVTAFPEVLAGMNLQNQMPQDTPGIDVTYSKEDFFVHPNENHTWGIPLHQVDICDALSGDLSLSFRAHDPDTDIGHTIVYWMAKADGMFKSFDLQQWEKKADWH